MWGFILARSWLAWVCSGPKGTQGRSTHTGHRPAPDRATAASKDKHAKVSNNEILHVKATNQRTHTGTIQARAARNHPHKLVVRQPTPKRECQASSIAHHVCAVMVTGGGWKWWVPSGQVPPLPTTVRVGHGHKPLWAHAH
jgi:hypothetical protein